MSEAAQPTDDGTLEATGKWIWYCPWCGVAFATEADAYTHTYEHRDKGPYAVEVLDAFEKIPLAKPGNALADGTGGER
jgi:hypothetical protein